MNFPPGLFQAAINALRTQRRSHSEVRGAMRYRLLGSATIIPCSLQSARVPAVVGVCDLSASGIGLIHRASLKVGERFILTLPATVEQGRRAALFLVMFCHPLTLESYRIGGKFARELQTAVTDDAVEPAIQASPADAVFLLPVPQLVHAFREQAHTSLSPEEQAQVRDLDQRLEAVAG